MHWKSQSHEKSLNPGSLVITTTSTSSSKLDSQIATPPSSSPSANTASTTSALRQPDGATSKWLAHVPQINLGVIELILNPQTRMALTPTLLEEVASNPKEKYRAGTAALLRDTLPRIRLSNHRIRGPARG